MIKKERDIFYLKKRLKYIIAFCEPIGLVMILLAFGSQFFGSESDEITREEHILRINEKLNVIWGAICFDEMHTERFQEKAIHQGKIMMTTYNFEDISKDVFKDWSCVKRRLESNEKQKRKFVTWELIFYAVGSLFVIASKFAEVNNGRLKQSECKR